MGVKRVLLKHVELYGQTKKFIESAPVSIIIRDRLVRNDITSLLQLSTVEGISTNFYENKDIIKAKLLLKQNNINVNTFESKIPFSEFKVDSNGLIPVIVQDYKSDEVLMLAYMNEEAYNKTITGGKMTYYSRGRQTIWLKGETSGHYQYVKELTTDCDKDTILAKVLQIGPACHTGSPSCFFTELVRKDYRNYNPFHVFQDVYDVILDRRKNPKEGSYTNYLFDKGIDKILKKCGEEATEITIAAKNPGTEELRYEIADYLYHLMVLMAECGLDWSDITNELAHRK
ncbi:MAG: bifunctional phosphoribosyl-AMP cyclohydrolase/phosphoribosyl-ATP diphosphatase HisIE [Clostridiales bacterium]|nr:bifunctional phosphoribosyl-AMP cyclohydrolase/phosphoribosyl-ATP diphosphatase HisIE [Clostridiales bacterium]